MDCFPAVLYWSLDHLDDLVCPRAVFLAPGDATEPQTVETVVMKLAVVRSTVDHRRWPAVAQLTSTDAGKCLGSMRMWKGGGAHPHPVRIPSSFRVGKFICTNFCLLCRSVSDPNLLLCGSGSWSQLFSNWIRIRIRGEPKTRTLLKNLF